MVILALAPHKHIYVCMLVQGQWSKRQQEVWPKRKSELSVAHTSLFPIYTYFVLLPTVHIFPFWPLTATEGPDDKGSSSAVNFSPRTCCTSISLLILLRVFPYVTCPVGVCTLPYRPGVRVHDKLFNAGLPAKFSFYTFGSSPELTRPGNGTNEQLNVIKTRNSAMITILLFRSDVYPQSYNNFLAKSFFCVLHERRFSLSG